MKKSKSRQKAKKKSTKSKQSKGFKSSGLKELKGLGALKKIGKENQKIKPKDTLEGCY